MGLPDNPSILLSTSKLSCVSTIHRLDLKIECKNVWISNVDWQNGKYDNNKEQDITRRFTLYLFTSYLG